VKELTMYARIFLNLRRPRLAALGGLLLCLLVPSLPASPQAASGTITGVVTDPTGAVVPGAKISLTQVRQGVTFRYETTSGGLYEAPFLPPGEYTAAAEMQGFKRVVKSDLVLTVGQVMRVDFQLEVGALTQAVEVRGDATQLLKPESSELGQVINFRQVVDLPLNGRDFTDLIALNAGVTTGLQGSFSNQFNVNGGRGDQNMFLLEGVDNMNIEGTLLVEPSIDAIQEFQIQTGNFSAEFGRSTGGVIQVKLRSGTNSFHGSAFEFVRNDLFDANGFFDNQVPPRAGETHAPKTALRRNQFGFTFGGPIKKDKAFFFGDYQGSRQRQGRSEIFSVPTLLERQGDFSQTLAADQPLFQNALLGTVYPGCDLTNFTADCQRLPASALDSPAVAIAQLYPVPNIPGTFVPGLGTFNNYAASGSSADDVNAFDVRVDFHASDRDLFGAHYSFADNDSVVPAAFGDGTIGPCIDCGFVLNLLAGVPVLRNQLGGLTYIRNFSPTVVNEFRAGFNRTFNFFSTTEGGRNLADEFGIPNVNINDLTTGLPWFLFDPVPMWTGTSPFLPFLRGGTSYQLTDNLSVVRGRHRLKTGFDLRRRLDNDFSNFFPRGAYIYAPFFTGNSFADFLTGRALVITQDLLPGTYGIRGIEYAGYVQDDLKLHPRFTLNLGIRYEYFPGYVEVRDRNANLDLNTGRAVLAGRNGQPRQFVPKDLNNWAPRVGFAWTPSADGKTVLRGGYGISYFNSNNFFAFNTINPPFTAAFTHLNIDFNTLDAEFLTSDGLPVQLRPTVENFDASNPAGTWRVVDPTQRSPYTQYFSFGVQRALPWDTVLDISYVGSRGVKLPGQIEANPAPPGDPTTMEARRIRRSQIPNVDSITLLANAFASNYHSLQVKAEKRFSHGLQFLGTYTWAKSIDNLSGSPLTGGGDSNPSASSQNPFDLAADRARSSYDRAHRFVFAFNYDLPFGRGQRFGAGMHGLANGFLGGWQVNGIVTLSSGLPFTVFATSSASCGCTAGELRADRLADGNLPEGQRKPTGWFDSSAFRDPPPESYGNAGRNIINGPGMANVDFSLFKKFRLREKVELQFRGEFFNLFNRANFFYPTSVNNATWQAGGLLTRAFPPRIVQLALKVLF
jgi:outer membrane receptor protein involved in Fe transport